MAKNENLEGPVSIMDLNMDSVPDLQTLPSGSEAELEIKHWKFATLGEKKLPVFKVVLENVASNEETEYEAVFHNVWLPHSGNTDSQNNRARRDLVDLCTVFNLDAGLVAEYFSSVTKLAEDEEIPSFEEAKGRRAFAILKETEYEGRLKNEIQRFVKGA